MSARRRLLFFGGDWRGVAVPDAIASHGAAPFSSFVSFERKHRGLADDHLTDSASSAFPAAALFLTGFFALTTRVHVDRSFLLEQRERGSRLCAAYGGTARRP
jgi:hypothetical protein